MFLHTEGGKKWLSVLTAVSAFVMIQSMGSMVVKAAPAASAVGAVSVSCEGNAPSSGASASYGTGVVTTDFLNVRSERSTSSKVITVLLKDAKITLQEKQGNWYKITVKGKTGWVSAAYVKATPNQSSAATTAGKTTTSTTATTVAQGETSQTETAKTNEAKTTVQKTTTKAKTTTTTKAKTTTATTKAASSSNAESCTVKADYLNVRSGPGTKYSLIGGLKQGKTVKVLEKNGEWVKVQMSSTKAGWVSSSYVKFGGSTGSTTTTKKAAATTKKTTTTTKKAAVTVKKDSNGGTSASSTGKITITADTLNARADASSSAKKVETVRRNEVYVYTAVKNGWFKIKTPGGVTAYVCGDYVKEFTGYAIDGGGKYLWPTQTTTRISSRFGPRDGRNHYGIDIAAPGGSQIMAVASGKVIRKAFEAGGFGHYIVIQQSDGICAYYGHMQAASFLKVGASVKAGDTIGLVGSTGRSTGNHLHLEFRRGTTKINPLNYYPNMR